MNAFLLRWQHHILGALSGFDRLRFRGSLRLLSTVGGVMRWLASQNILLKDFVGHCERQTQQLRRHSEQLAQEAQRKVLYLPGFCNKEELVQKIRREQGVADNGLIAVLSTLEMCRSFDIHRNRQTQHIDLVARKRKAWHYYFYFDDGKFGHTQVRLMSWFPFDTHVVLNGREWLAHDLDRAGIDYQRCDNCFRWIADFAAAQQLAHKQPKIHWAGQWERLRRRVHPLHAQFFPATEEFPPLSYYWTSEQTEWATDLAFRKPDELALLRAHGLIKRIPRTHRYELTAIGRTTITALLAARNATPRQLAG